MTPVDKNLVSPHVGGDPGIVGAEPVDGGVDRVEIQAAQPRRRAVSAKWESWQELVQITATRFQIQTASRRCQSRFSPREARQSLEQIEDVLPHQRKISNLLLLEHDANGRRGLQQLLPRLAETSI